MHYSQPAILSLECAADTQAWTDLHSFHGNVLDHTVLLGLLVGFLPVLATYP